MLDAIKNDLENTYLIGFTVKYLNNDNNRLIIKPQDEYLGSFIMKTTIIDDVRLIVECEPDDYGRIFLDNINRSNNEKREMFIKYWEQIGSDSITLKINDNNIYPQDFIQDKTTWQSFYLRFSKAPFYDVDTEHKQDKVVKYVTLICGMILSILEYSIEGIEGYEEGKKDSIVSVRYERNPINRELCLKAHGYKCQVCGFDFEKEYGMIGKNFIEVHHIIPVSTMGESYKIDPINDLVPLCSNCHSMIHRRKPPFSVEELKDIRNKRNIQEVTD